MKLSYLLWLCDIHKSRSSMRLYGVFTTRKNLDKHLNILLKEGGIEQDPDSPLHKKTVNGFTISEINNNYDYVLVEEISLNEEI